MGVDGRKNVIVLGAGASKEFGLPTGNELATQIASIVDIRFDDFGSRLKSGDYKIVDTLRHLTNGNNINEYLRAGWRIRDNMPLAPSIDNYLDTHRNDPHTVVLGKLAICHAIQVAEGKSKLFVDYREAKPTLDFSELEDTWIQKLFKILNAKRDFEDFLIALQEITFVSFNYDRCVHQYFAIASANYFDLDDSGVQQVLDALQVIYPYGNVGEYSYHRTGSSNFGILDFQQDLLDTSKKIRTFTEGSDAQVLEQIHGAFWGSQVVIFLGFGFLDLNMNLLFRDQSFAVEKVLATGKGLSANSINDVVTELRAVFDSDFKRQDWSENKCVFVLNQTCGELIREFERFLAGSIRYTVADATQ